MELRAKYQIQDIEKLITDDLKRQGFDLTGIDNENTTGISNLTSMELWFEISHAPIAVAEATNETEKPTTTEENPAAYKSSRKAKKVYPPERIQKMVDSKKRKAEERKAQQEAQAATEAHIEETRQAVAAVYSSISNGNGSNGHYEENPLVETVEVVAATGPSFPG